MFVEDIEEPSVARSAEQFVELLTGITRLAASYIPAVYVKTGFAEIALLGES